MDDNWGSREALIAEVIELRRQVGALEAGTRAIGSPGPASGTVTGQPEPLYTQEQLMTILDSMPSGIEIVEAANNRISFVNKLGHELHGTDVTGMDIRSHLGMNEAFGMDGTPFPVDEMPIIRSLKNGETVHNIEISYQTAVGSQKVFLISAAPLRDAYGRLVAAVSSFLDITRRKDMENDLNDALRAAESRRNELDAIIKSIPDGLIIYDLEERPVFANEAAKEISSRFRIQVNDKIGEKALKSYTEDGRPVEQVNTPLRRALQDGNTTTDLVIHSAPEHGPVTYIAMSCAPVKDSRGAITGAISLLRDITQNRIMQAALGESEKRYREIVKYAPAGIYEIDFRTRRFLTVNDAMCEVTGYSRAELLAMDPMDLLDESGRQTFQRRIQMSLAGETPEPVADYRIRAKDGRIIDAALVSTFTQDEARRPTRATVIAIDITERKKLEAELRRKADELAQADRNKNLFLNTLSHELRNPLAAIVMSLDLLAHVADGSAQTARAIRVLKRQTGHLTHIVDDLLDVTRITNNKIQLKRRPVEMVELLRRTVVDYRLQYDEKGVELISELPDTPVMLHVDPVRLQQAVGNLLHNALKFTPAGGHVCLSASQDEPSRRLVIQVADTGAGIAPDVLSRLFEPFSQAEQSLARDQGGLGLGLSIVKGIAELHGGRVEAHSDGLGKGSQFIIRLPM